MRNKYSIYISAIFLSLASFGSTAVYADGIISNECLVAVPQGRRIERSPEPYLLPSTHPLSYNLHRLFKNANMFDSPISFRREGFKVKMGHRQLMVGAHPSFPGYLFKKFINKRSQEMQLDNYIKRIKGSHKVRQTIDAHHFKHLLVPQKWLYELPRSFSDSRGKRSYILIVEDMNIFDDAEEPLGENSRRYYNMDIEILTELCITLHALGGCDAFPRNQPFTRSGQIAFVDTEHVGEKKLHFLKHIVPALNEELKQYACALWSQLENKN